MGSASRDRAGKAVANVLPRTVEAHAKGDRFLVNGVPLRIQWAGEGWLGDVRPVLEGSDDRPDIVVVRRMSPGAREALAEAGLSWVDETGAAEISVDSIVVARPGRDPERTSEWTPSVVAVAEALLCDTRATVKATREVTGLSTGSCTNALRVLEDSGLLVSDAARGRNSARRVEDFGRLLDAYASEVAGRPPGPRLELGMTWRDPLARLAEMGDRWRAAGRSWACTGVIAAAVLAPHLTSGTTAEVYVDAETLSDLDAASRDVGLRPIDGGRLSIRPFPTPTTRRLAETTNGLRIAPWPRVYADLRTSGVRGEQAAEHLRETMRG